MVDAIKNKIVVKKEEFKNLMDNERALILAIQELTEQIRRLNNLR